MSEIKSFLEKFNNYYLNANKHKVEKTAELDTSDVVLYKINSVTYKKDSPRREALENVLSSLRIEGINFIYLILGNSEGVEFYYGLSRDYSYTNELEIDIDEIGKYILEPSIKGNFRGSEIQKIEENTKRKILERIGSNKYYSIVEGVPGVLEKDDEFQGVDRLADVMSNSPEYGFMIISSLVSDTELEIVKKNIFNIYATLAEIGKESRQVSNGTNTSTNESKSEGQSETKGTSKGTSDSHSQTDSTGTNESKSEGTSETKGTSKGANKSESRTETTTNNEGTNEGTNKSITLQTGTSKGSSSSSSSSSTNKSSSEGTVTTSATTKGSSKSQAIAQTTGSNQSTNQSTSTNTNTTTGSNTSKSIAKTTGSNQSSNQSTSTNTNTTTGTSEGTSYSQSVTTEIVDKQAQDWIKYIDDMLLARLDYGSAKGMFRSGMFCFSNSKAILKKLENTVMSLFSGETGNKIPLRSFLIKDDLQLESLKNLQLPKIHSDVDTELKSLLSQSDYGMGNLISSKELSLIAGLPKKDIMGLELKEEVEFGLNFETFDNPLELGYLLQSRNKTNKIVSIDKKSLDKHIFITGVTGSGKTTTCLNILENSNLPFLVIEPAKTEYRILKEKYPDLLIFTLGNDSLAPFRLNPFEFFPHESITSRVDMIKASIEAAFDMEAAIPQIIESAIYECYENKGWNIGTNKNEYYGDKAFDDGVYAFPTLDDLLVQVENVVKKQGFDERLKNDYLGSIRARLKGLIVGSKGFMLNTKRSINFKQLLNQRVVFELEEIRNGSEKSLIMGFILTHLLEAIKSNFEERNEHKLNHIILIEEAHRLLSKYEPGDSMNKKQGVEVFTDMLAEIRKYGECLMIADQIPNKLAPEVLKNTNTKIVHRIFAADDKKAIGNTMALEDEQSDFLSKLRVGEAIVFSGGFNKSVSVKINQSSKTTDKIIDKELIKQSALEFYTQNAKSGILIGSDIIQNPTKDDILKLFELQKEGVKDLVKQIRQDETKITTSQKELRKFIDNGVSIDILVRIFMVENSILAQYTDEIKEYLDKYLNNSFLAEDTRKFRDIFSDA
ncbi:ATP-binding protein [Campylobacter sp. CLAX-7218-21]|uniref:ATP-binding protein n=1 Tax=Campylobacter devanensis TaxID=3161138 RepID=UPI002EC63800|nr:ATP-binding protein [Campylobacter sp. CLAX-7218-21]